MTDPKDTPRCTATAKSTGQRCKRRPHPGSNVCVKHGAAKGTPAAAAAARRRDEQRILHEMERIVTTYGVAREIDPGMALLEEVHRTAGHVAWLGHAVSQLQPEELFQYDDRGFQKDAVIVQMYARERAHLAKVSADAVRIGLEARMVSYAERLGEQVLTAMRGFAAELGHDPDDPAVVEAGARHLRTVTG
jgi:hypothetical protein